MQLRYANAKGEEEVVHLGKRSLVIGRGPGSDIIVGDDKASRKHCEVRLWDGDYVLKDLSSHNGTYVNGNRTDVVRLRNGDEIRIGSSVIYFEDKRPIGTSTAIRQVEGKMEHGKGYKTILREIVDDSGSDEN